MKDREISKLRKEKENLTVEAVEAQKLAKQTYVIDWDNVVKQAKYFFAKSELDFNVLNSEKSLEEMLGEKTLVTSLDEGPMGQTEIISDEETQVIPADGGG